MNEKKHSLILCLVIFILVAGLSILTIFGTDKTYSDSERRPLAKLPQLTWQRLTSGSYATEFETYAADTFPFREAFRGLKSVTTLFVMGEKTNHEIYLQDGYLAKVEYPMDTASITHAAAVFQSVYDQYLTDTNCKVYLSVIPDKNACLGPAAGQLVMDYEDFTACLSQQMPYATTIPIADLLSAEDYYRTDTHWRQEQILDVAQRLVSQMEAASISDPDADTRLPVETSTSLPAETQTTDSSERHNADTDTAQQLVLATDQFQGVYYGQAALPLQAESLYYVTNPAIAQMQAYDHENDRSIPVYNKEKVSEKDPYEMFLSGSLSLVTLVNPVAKTDRELILFRDSFGSSIAPLLAMDYRKVTLVDIRYLPVSRLNRYLTFENSDVLFLYSTSVLNHSETLKK